MENNAAKFKDAIIELDYDFAKVDGKLQPCIETECELCDFYESKNSRSCDDMHLIWLIEDACQVSAKETNFLKTLGSNYYIARNKDGALHVFEDMPHRNDSDGVWLSSGRSVALKDMPFTGIVLSAVQWTDKKPWKVKALLKLAE